MIKALLAVLLVLIASPAVAASHGTCSSFPPAAYYQSLGLTDSWVATRSTLVTGTPSSPTCGTGATEVEDTSTGFHNLQQTVSVFASATTYAFSVYAKRVIGADNVSIVLFDSNFANDAGAGVDLGACSIHSTSGSGFNLLSATATPAGNGWCLIQQVISTPANYTSFNIQFLMTNASFAASYTGNGSSIAYWGVDLRPATASISIGDSTNYHSGFYTGFLAPFGGSEVTPNSMNIQPALFPGGTTINWNYSATPCAGICGYLAVDYANYSGSNPAVPVPPIQVNNLPSATVSSSLVFSGDITGFDAIYDTFLYTTSSAIVRSDEFEIFLHTNAAAAAYVLSQTQVGTVTISGINWTVAVDPNAGGEPDVLFMPTNQADILNNTIDLLAIFNYAKAHSLITGNEWFAGTSIGAEPMVHNGTMAINSFSAVSPIIIGDSTNYTSGAYNGFLAPFGGTEVTPNQMVISNPGQFPNDVTISWNYSGTPCVGVCAFLAIDYGNYSGTVTQVPVTPVQVNNLNAASETHNLTFGGTLSGYDVIDDTFLYADSGGMTRSKEVEVFLHTNTQVANFVAGAPSQFSTTEVISGITWTVACYCSGGTPDILFMPTNQADVTNATLDLKAMYLYAKSQGAITGNEWFTGMALGAEPQANGGSMVITSFSATSN